MKSRSGGKSRRRKPEKAQVTLARGQEHDTTIVAIGASAGGVEALTDLMNHLPADTGMAFVLVQHLDPKHHSILTELLARKTAMSVTEVSDGLPVKGNHVYVIPPNASMSISEDTLHLGPREESRGMHMPVDNFMRSLAEQKGNKGIGVILSGSGSDGTLGMAEIQAHGGVTFAQDEATAKYYGMPRSVVEAGCADYVLPPKGIAKEVTRIARHPYVAQRSLPGAAESVAVAGTGLDAIFQILRRATGVDFTHYRQTTILRRIQRRSENTERLLRNARSAFFSALHYVQRSELAPCDVEAITARLVKLQEALQESVPQQESAMLAEGDGWADSV